MLFQFDKRNRVVLHPDAVKLTNHIKKLDDRQLLFVILYCDYHSKYHQFSDEQRMLFALKDVYRSTDYDIMSQPNIKEAIEEYRSLQYDTRRETIRVFQSKIEMLNRELIEEESASRIKGIIDTINKLQDEIDRMQRKIDADTDSYIEIKGGGRLSLIEKWQENMREYKKRKMMQGIEIVDG